MKSQAGFTLIELVMVIVILGILAAVAIPQFVDLSADAQTAKTNSIAQALTSGSTMNFANEKVNPMTGTAVANCTDVASTLEGGAMPAGYAITAAAIGAAEGDSAQCTVTGPGATSATFTGINVDPTT